ncbi:MAG: beta family protein [Planctomycetaceae bacterium]|nr:beta family protein [Planctomycetaceae bacterium]
MIQFNYLITLKTKTAEFEAIHHLHERVSGFLPLLEITPVPLKWTDGETDPEKAKTPREHCEWIIEQAIWAQGDRPFFLDGFYVENVERIGDEEPIEFTLSRLYERGARPIPVLGIDRPEDYIEACHRCGRGTYAIRLVTNDLGNPEELSETLRSLLVAVDVKPHDCHLIVDLGDIVPSSVAIIQTYLPSQFRDLPQRDDWRTVTFSATSFPPSVSDIEPYTLEPIARQEWELWRRIREGDNVGRCPIFGDYGIASSELSILDPRQITIAPKVKYTDKMQWMVCRGQAEPRKKTTGSKTVVPPRREQFARLAKLITEEQDLFSGDYFSWGDEQIAKAADGDGSASLQHWVTIGIVHHVAYVVQQLSSLRET